MTINLALGPVVSLVAGILILIGLIGIFGWGALHARTASETVQHEPVAVPMYIYASVGPAT